MTPELDNSVVGKGTPDDPYRAAGILFVSKDGQALFLKRGDGGDHASEWCFPGGHIEDGETADTAAQRETVEEIGFLPPGDRTLLARNISCDEVAGPAAQQVAPLTPNGDAIVVSATAVDFTTFLQRIDETFEITISGEHVGYAWAPVDQPPEPLHPGARVALDRISMNELDVAHAIAEGRLTSPQHYMNVCLFDIRITAVGYAYRSGKKEFCWRDPAIYLNPEFVARCNGLPVIYEHPEKATLNSEEFNDRIVGTIFYPYIKGDEVWGIAKMYDESAILLMKAGQLSTSPCVVLRDPADKSTVELGDGTKLLIEGEPSLLDHIAICGQGVWDKGEEPSGVVNHLIGDVQMTEEEQKAADAKARKDAEELEAKTKSDAEAVEKLDKLLTCMDSVTTAVDSLSKRMDAMEAGDEGEGEAEKLAADKARKDAEEKEAKDKADAEEEEAKKKADAEELKSVKDKLADLETKMPKELSDADYSEMADSQAKADNVFSLFGKSAPRPLQGETNIAYRKRLASGLKDHSTEWKGVDLSTLPDSAFSIAEGKVYADAAVAARSPALAPDGELMTITRDLPSGHREHTFVGHPSAWMRHFSGSRSYLTGITVPNKGGA